MIPEVAVSWIMDTLNSPFLLHIDIFFKDRNYVNSLSKYYIYISIDVICTFFMLERLSPFIIYDSKIYANLYI